MTNINEIMEKAVAAYNEVENAHAEYPPSSAKRWCNCPGSVALSVDAVDETSKYAAEGSLAHLLCELMLKQVITTGFELDPLVGDTYMIDGFEIEVTEEMTESIWSYINTIIKDAQANDLKRETFLNAVTIEKTVTITPECSGTSDCYLAIPFTKLYVYDFKYGAGVPVNVEDNYQMKCYAVGALNDYEADGTSYMDVIELVIIQPRARHKDGEVRRWVTTRKEILEFKKEIETCIAACKVKNAKINPGHWCRWCPAKHKCPGLFDDASKLAKKAFDAVDVGQDVLVAMTEVQMVEVLDMKETLTGFLKAVEAHAQARLETGDSVGTYKLVRGRATRSWVNQEEVEAVFEAQISGDKLYTKKFVSPAQMEKVLKAEGICKTVKDAKSHITDFVDPGEGKIAIAPAHDKRDQVFLNAGEYFD